MSTHARLIKQTNNTFESIYIHYDGYPNNIIPLLTNYNSIEQIEKLFSFGDIESLDSTVEKTIFFCRDKGDDEYETQSKITDFVENFMSPYIDYYYMFIDKKWELIAEYGKPNDIFLNSKFAIK